MPANLADNEGLATLSQILGRGQPTLGQLWTSQLSLQDTDDLKYESIWIYPVCCDYVWTGMHAAFYSGICIQIAG